MKTLANLLEDYLTHMRAMNFSPHTLRQCRYDVKACLRWLESCLGVSCPERLRAQHLRAWQRHLAERATSKGRPLKARSVNKRLADVKGFLGYLSVEGYLQPHLADALEAVKEPKVLPGSVLKHAQVRRMIDRIGTDTAEGYRTRTMLELLYSSGLRVAELLGMNLDSVDFANATALVRGKGQKDRVVPVGRAALRFLEGYIKAMRPQLLADPAERALFIDGCGRRIPYYTFRRTVAACAATAGLAKPVTPHTFRRSCTTEMLRCGANMYHLKELLGHESLETLKHYAKLTINDLKATHSKCHPRERDGHCVAETARMLDMKRGQ